MVEEMSRRVREGRSRKRGRANVEDGGLAVEEVSRRARGGWWKTCREGGLVVGNVETGPGWAVEEASRA